MNWKLFGTMTALIGVGASIALAQGTAPTIVQGDYISNVFGNSNFIKNPNAKLNTKDVTTVTATVLRSITTPLVATSEFTVAIGTANGTATWATRAFDAGMKGQNCEARFSYRGFAATSKVHIKQGANTVASLTLTPSTDPRIASINFPCGDLSAATTFQVTDTAILGGVNEIGGIYVGLATNMANVAQAEMYGAVQWAGCALPEPVRTGSTAFGNFASGGTCSSKTLFGKATSANEADGSVTFNNLPAGYYFLQTNTFAYIANPSGAGIVGQIEAYEDTSGTASGRSYIQAQVASVLSSQPTPSGWFYFSSTANRTFRLRATISNAAQSLSLALGYSGSPEISQFALYRFPSSSELVVTPERQNTFAGIKASGGVVTNSVTSAAWAKLTQSSGTLTRTTFGKAKVETNNDYSITIENMPVGNYYISATGIFQARSSAAADTTACFFGSADSATGGAQISSMQVLATGDTSVTVQDQFGSTFGGVYNNTSVANRTFFIQSYRAAGAGSCFAYSDANRPLTISVIPLDQPSNSALYVEGPVKAAATGAAIPAGYVGQILTNAQIWSGLGVNPSNFGAQITVTPGVWIITSQCDFQAVAPFDMTVSTVDSSNNIIFPTVGPIGNTVNTNNNGVGGGSLSATQFFRFTTTTGVYTNCSATQGAGAQNTAQTTAIRIN